MPCHPHTNEYALYQRVLQRLDGELEDILGCELLLPVLDIRSGADLERGGGIGRE